MIAENHSSISTGISPSRRQLLKSTPAVLAAAGAMTSPALAQPMYGSTQPQNAPTPVADLRKSNIVGYMLAHEQFPVPELVQIGADAARAGFSALATSDHLQPWQANEGHSGQAWVTLSSVGSRAPSSWLGTTVTCPTMRYNPAIVAEGFASLSLLYPGRVFLGVGSGEALNEEAATGGWPKWPERWERLVEAIDVIRALWSGQEVRHQGKYFTVNARLYDPPAQPIPLLTAANGRKSIRLAGQFGDGLITDPKTWKEHKSEWQDAASKAGKNPSQMPVLVEQYVVVGGQNDAQPGGRTMAFWSERRSRLTTISQVQSRLSSRPISRCRWSRLCPIGRSAPTRQYTSTKSTSCSTAALRSSISTRASRIREGSSPSTPNRYSPTSVAALSKIGAAQAAAALQRRCRSKVPRSGAEAATAVFFGSVRLTGPRRPREIREPNGGVRARIQTRHRRRCCQAPAAMGIYFAAAGELFLDLARCGDTLVF